MWSIRLLGAAFCAWALSMGCGDEGDDGTGSPNTAGTSGAGVGGTTGLPAGTRIVASSVDTPRAGECMSSADCSGGAMGCGEVPSGYRVCTFQTPQATMPSALPSADQCDASRPCAAGACFNVSVFSNGICGLAPPVSYNVCRDNGCTSDAQCPGGLCGPAGFSANEMYAGGLIRQCMPAACRADSECTKQAGGICAVVQAGCDLATAEYLPAQMACVYPNGCTSLSDCRLTPGAFCKVVRGEGVCVTQG